MENQLVTLDQLVSWIGEASALEALEDEAREQRVREAASEINGDTFTLDQAYEIAEEVGTPRTYLDRARQREYLYHAEIKGIGIYVILKLPAVSRRESFTI